MFDASGSHVEKKMTNDMLWLRERDGVCVVSWTCWWRQENRRANRLLGDGARGGACKSPNDSTEEHGMWDRGELRAMDVDEKMDEDKKKGAWR